MPDGRARNKKKSKWGLCGRLFLELADREVRNRDKVKVFTKGVEGKDSPTTKTKKHKGRVYHCLNLKPPSCLHREGGRLDRPTLHKGWKRRLEDVVRPHKQENRKKANVRLTGQRVKVEQLEGRWRHG